MRQNDNKTMGWQDNATMEQGNIQIVYLPGLSLAWSQQGDGRTEVAFLCIAFNVEKNSGDKTILHHYLSSSKVME